MTISIETAIQEATRTLREGAVTEPRREAGSLLTHLLGSNRSFVLTHGDEIVPDREYRAFRSFIARRAAGEPLQYLTGRQEFFKLDFEVTPDVLIPRPETELLVEVVLELSQDNPAPGIADIGTGSGCVAISLLHELPSASAIATDISPAALRVAERNAKRHGVHDRLKLVESNCFSEVQVTQTFSMIASNPPYVSDEELSHLQREVRFEPNVALAGGPDGLSVIRRLLVEARPFLRSGGYLVFEIGFGQNAAVEQLIDRRIWKLVEIRKDLQGIPRTLVLQGR